MSLIYFLFFFYCSLVRAEYIYKKSSFFLNTKFRIRVYFKFVKLYQGSDWGNGGNGGHGPGEISGLEKA